jgi:putative transposase
MSRALRIEFPGAIYHVMARGVGRMDIFVDDTDRRTFLTLVGGQVASGALVVHAFCLMPNHTHRLCETPFGGLGRCMRDLLGAYARAFNKRHGRVGHLFQDRYKALLAQDGDYLVACSRYIHLNPDGNERTRPTELYPWSSYHNYSGGPPVADWVTTSKVLSYFAGTRDYLNYLEEGRSAKIPDPFAEAFAGLIWGDERFVREMRALVGATGHHPPNATASIHPAPPRNTMRPKRITVP